MKNIHKLAEIDQLPDNEALVRYAGAVVYVRSYGADGFRFHSNPFLSEWFETFEECRDAAIDYLFSNADTLVLLENFIRSIVLTSPWVYTQSGGRLTIIVPNGSVSVVNRSLKVIHATDDDIQCSTYGFIESVKPYKKAI
jgi:hypothetical protein